MTLIRLIVSTHHGGPERIGIDPLAAGHFVMALVHQDQVKEIIREGGKPSVGPAGQLLNVGNHNIWTPQ